MKKTHPSNNDQLSNNKVKSLREYLDLLYKLSPSKRDLGTVFENVCLYYFNNDNLEKDQFESFNNKSE